MDLGLTGEAAVVVGGANGIGRAIAMEFAAEGAQVAIVDLDPAGAKLAALLERERSVRSLGVVADATDYAAVEAAAGRVVESLGRCDHIVVAVGAGSNKYGFPFWNLTPADWDRVIQVNLIGPVNVAHAFAPILREQRRGTLLLLASVAGQIGSQTDPPYSAAKAALINFAQCAARDLAPYNVRVNALSPGIIKTTLNKSVWEAWRALAPDRNTEPYDEWIEAKARRVSALGRCQRPEDVAAMAVFLASRRAENITGQTANVDAGQVMHS